MPDSRSTYRSEWWRGAVIYQIYPRSFLDTTGTGVGDLNGITQKLDYIAELGVDGIWISPFFTSPMKDYGYDVADYCDIDPIFGDMTDFDALIARAHSLNLKVIIDQVYAHTSDEHTWFQESRQDRTNAKAGWYVWADPKPDGSPPSNWQAVFGGPAWEWDARRQQYFMHNFLSEQPQLNLHNEDVQDALLAVAKFWLDRGVDGFRLDAINFSMHNPALTDNPPSGLPQEKATRPFDLQRHIHNQSQPGIADFLARVRKLTDNYDGVFTVAEVPGADPISEMRAYTHGETHLNSAYNFDFLYARKLTPQKVIRSLQQWCGDENEGWPSWAFSNHDAPRALTRWVDDAYKDRAAKTLMMLLMSLRGTPIIYQGEELGMVQADIPFDRLLDPEAIANWPRTLGRDGARTPMPWESNAPFFGFSSTDPWLPPDRRHQSSAVDRQVATTNSTLASVRALLELRRSHPALKSGDIQIHETSDAVLEFERILDGEKIICIFNLSAEGLRLEVRDGLKLLATENGPCSKTVKPPSTLGAWQGLWLSA